ncbi:recombinase [Streptomyces virginiae]|uniref:Recombinase n=1 Tax=Streptomyces virginiae TaxID=1961 RepID=A0A0L8MXY7_STRVG|nr:endonuclease domain-containing protein [Streptomyces virginiae]KOG55287.1 recombinase [Streptomyces virginiae]
MAERVVPGRADHLVTLAAADSVWASLTAGSAVPATSAVFTCFPSDVRPGRYVLLGACVVELVRIEDGWWRVPEAEVRRAAAAWNAVEMDTLDLVRIGPFRGVPEQQHTDGTLHGWRRRISWELQEADRPGRQAGHEPGPGSHLAGVDWRRLLVQRSRGRGERSWWLPRSVVRLLDTAEHTEIRWLHTTQACKAQTAVTEQHRRDTRATDSQSTTGVNGPAAIPQRPYTGELRGQLYSVLSRRPGMSRRVAGWVCAVCGTVPAAVLDHCHEHGYVRAPVCPSCNTLERPDHLYDNDIRVASRYQRLFDTAVAVWLRHWHRCPGCRTRTTLPLPHLAAWTAHTATRALRPTHPSPRGRRPCGMLRVSWTGSQNTPRSCLLTISVDFCPTGEHRVLARVPYREATEQFRTWLAETAPAVAAEAGPDRLDDLPTKTRPVIADTNGEDLSLF